MLRHIHRVGGQNQYIFSSLGNKIYYDAKLLHCFSPPTWLPCKPSISRFRTITVFFDRLSMIDLLSLIFKNIWSFGSLAQNDTKIRSLFIKIHASNDECLRCLVVVSVTCVHKTENPGLAFNRFNWCRHDFITLCDWGVFCFCTLEFSLVNRKTICKESASVLEYVNVSPRHIVFTPIVKMEFREKARKWIVLSFSYLYLTLSGFHFQRSRPYFLHKLRAAPCWSPFYMFSGIFVEGCAHACVRQMLNEVIKRLQHDPTFSRTKEMLKMWTKANMVTASFNTCQHSWKDRSNSPNICSNKCWANVEANVGTVWTSLYAGVTADIDPFSRIWTPPHTKTLLLPSTESRTRNKCDMTHPFTFWNGDIQCLSFRAMQKEVTSFPSSRPAEIFHRKKLATQKCCIS